MPVYAYFRHAAYAMLDAALRFAPLFHHAITFQRKSRFVSLRYFAKMPRLY